MIQCINASLSGDYIGAGILLVASALSFGFIMNVIRR